MLLIYLLLTFNYYFIYSITETIKVLLLWSNAKWRNLYPAYVHPLIGGTKIVLAKIKKTFLDLNIYLLKLKHAL